MHDFVFESRHEIAAVVEHFSLQGYSEIAELCKIVVITYVRQPENFACVRSRKIVRRRHSHRMFFVERLFFGIKVDYKRIVGIYNGEHFVELFYAVLKDELCEVAYVILHIESYGFVSGTGHACYRVGP